MIGRIKSAAKAAVNALSIGESGWINLSGESGLSTFGNNSTSGQSVSMATAMQLSTIWACVKVTAEMAASVPLDLYQKGAGKQRDKVENELSDILTISPNKEQTPIEYWESMIANMLLRGNGVSQRLTVGKRLVGLKPIPNATPFRADNGELNYSFYDRGKREVLPAEEVFHLRGFGIGDGVGLSVIKNGVNSIGAALSADEMAGSFFKNGSTPSGILTTDGALTKDQRAQLQGMLKEYMGSSKSGKTMLLEAGVKHQKIQFNADDIQLLSTRKFSVEDLCRWVGTPPIVIGHSSEGQTNWGSGVEATLIQWLVTGINPLFTRIEARVRKDLIAPSDRRRQYAEYNREAVIQMDSRAKGDLLLKLRMGGFITGDEGRGKLNMPPRGGESDELFIQTSLAPVELIGKEKP